MDLVAFFTGQLEREMEASRKVLAQVPEDRDGFKPHPKSMELGYLAALVAQMPAWIALMIETDGLDLEDAGKSGRFQAKAAENNAALLKLAEDCYAQGKAALAGTTEEHLNGLWAFRIGGKVVRGGARQEQIADTLTHLAHHRGQLTVYLRLNDAKVPAIYGPSADERIG